MEENLLSEEEKMLRVKIKDLNNLMSILIEKNHPDEMLQNHNPVSEAHYRKIPAEKQI